MIKFQHRILGFTPDNLLAAAGVTLQTHGVVYQSLLPEVTAICETQVLITAENLNSLLKEAYRKDMFDISEYARFTRYIDVMDRALSSPLHIGIYWDSHGLIQAKFVDTGMLGDLGDLQRIQRMVAPAGTLQGWIGIYTAWLSGASDTYEEVVDQRLDIMASERIAPFWELIEDGNGPAAYPRNPPKRTLATFKSTYTKEMKAAYTRCLAAVRALVIKPSPFFVGVQTESVIFNGMTYFGHQWTSGYTGRIIFTISGTTAVDKFGRLTGRGFILDTSGNVLKKWSGWLPR